MTPRCLAHGVHGREPALLHRCRCQGRESDHVADRVDVGVGGAEELVDLDLAALVGVESGSRQIQVVGRPLPAGRVHHRLGGDPLAAAQRGDGAVVGHLHALDGLAEPERDRQVAQVEPQRLDDLVVAEGQHVAALVDDRHLGAQGGEHRGVLHADDAGTDHDHRAGDGLQLQDPVGVDDAPVVELDLRWAGRGGSGCQHDLVRRDLGVRVPVDHHRVPVDERRRIR